MIQQQEGAESVLDYAKPSTLTDANAAPLAPESARSRFAKWAWFVVGLIVVTLAWKGCTRYQAHQAEKAATKAAPVVLPELSKIDHLPTVTKKALPAKPRKETDKNDSSAGNKNITDSNLKPKTLGKSTEPLTNFDRELLNFERQIP